MSIIYRDSMRCRKEKGSSAVEFAATVFWVIVIALMGAHLIVGVQTVLILHSAAREGARAAAVGENVAAAVNASAPSITITGIQESHSGTRVTVTVSGSIPNISPFVGSIPASATSSMRYELDG